MDFGTIFTIITIVLLIAFWQGPNAVWGGATLGAIGGLLFAIVSALLGGGFYWSTIWTWVGVGVLIGAAFEFITSFIRSRH